MIFATTVASLTKIRFKAQPLRGWSNFLYFLDPSVACGNIGLEDTTASRFDETVRIHTWSQRSRGNVRLEDETASRLDT